jgi:hypothetical protein
MLAQFHRFNALIYLYQHIYIAIFTKITLHAAAK